MQNPSLSGGEGQSKHRVVWAGHVSLSAASTWSLEKLHFEAEPVTQINGRLFLADLESLRSQAEHPLPRPETPHCRFEFNTQRISVLKQLLLCCRPRFKCWRYKELSEFCQASFKFCLCIQGKKIGVHFRDLTSPSLLKSVVSVMEHEACVCQSRSASSRSF